MSTHTHTQGPWKVLENARGNGRICVTTANGAPVHAILCEIDVRSIGTDYLIRLANANLIAAAPDLLQVAQDFLLLAALHDWEGAAIDFAKATVSKAEGNA